MRWIVLLSASALLCAGCAPKPYLFNPDRAAKYLERNAEVPDDVARALMSGRIVEGMTQQEVALCLGKRCEKKTVSEEGQLKEVWKYYAPRRDRDELQGSSMWHEEKSPVASVVFGPDGRVERYRFYSGFRGARRPTDALPDAGVPEPRPPAARGDTREPASTPAAGDAKSTRVRGVFAGWPAMTLDGITRGGREPLAIIDRQVVTAGQSIRGVKVLAIESDGVLLQRGTDTQFLPTGQATTAPTP